jgi:hypothetical protein
VKGEREVYENEEKQLRGYLLGELGEDEGDRLERLLLVDDELFDLAEAIEADLLESFAEGDLPAEQRERVALRLAATAAGRRKIALARGLSTLVREEPRPAAVLPFRRRITDPFRTEGRIAALAASVLLLVGGTWLASKTVHPGDGAHLAGRAPAIESPSLRLPSLSPSPVPAAPDRVARAETPSPQAAVRTLVAVLGLATTRGESKIPTLDVPEHGRVELRLPLEEGMDEYRSFRVALGSGGRDVLERSGLEPREIGGVPTLVLLLDSRDLPAGSYKLTVSGVAAVSGGGSEPLAFPQFDVRRVSK